MKVLLISKQLSYGEIINQILNDESQDVYVYHKKQFEIIIIDILK